MIPTSTEPRGKRDTTSFPRRESPLKERIIRSRTNPDFSYSIWYSSSPRAKFYYKGMPLTDYMGKACPYPEAPYPSCWSKRYIAKLEDKFHRLCRDAEYAIGWITDGTWRKFGHVFFAEGVAYELYKNKEHAKKD